MKYIAEIGWNFVGDLSLAEDMIIAAKKANATFAKFQIWDPNNLKEGPWDKDGRREIYEQAFLDERKIKKLIEICSRNNIKFLASVFELKSLDLLRTLSSDYVKIPSHECNNWQLIDEARNRFQNIFLSVGAITSSDLSNLILRYGSDDRFTLMHCVSTYPLEGSKVNLPKIERFKEQCQKVGYSSHYTGIQDAAAATALGATLIEKHFTTDRNLPGRDNKFALLPNEFRKMTEDCDIISAMLQDLGDDIQDVEVDVAKIMRGRWNGSS